MTSATEGGSGVKPALRRRRSPGIEASRNASPGLELQSSTAALGGVAPQGGRGSVTGTILAVILLGVLQNGLTILTVNSFRQDVARDFLLVVAVILRQRCRGTRAIGLP